MSGRSTPVDWQEFARSQGEQVTRVKATSVVDEQPIEKQIYQQLREELAQEQQQALEQAQADGYQQGLQKARNEVEATYTPRLVQTLDAIEEQLTAFKDTVYDDPQWQQWLVQAVMHLASGVLEKELLCNEQQIQALVVKMLSEVKPPDVALEFSCNKDFTALANLVKPHLPDQLQLVEHDDVALLQVTTRTKVVTYDPTTAIRQTLDQWITQPDA